MGLDELQEDQAQQHFKQAAALFLESELKLNAAKCYYHGKLFKIACGIYLELNLMNEALTCGDSLMNEGEKEKNGSRIKELLLDAAWCFEKCLKLKKMYLAYEKVPHFQLWLEKLDEYRTQNGDFDQDLMHYLRTYTQYIEIDLTNLFLTSEFVYNLHILRKFETLPELTEFQTYLRSITNFAKDLERIVQPTVKFKKLLSLEEPDRANELNSNDGLIWPILFYLINEKYYENLALVLSLHFGYDVLYLINRLFKQNYLACSVEIGADYHLTLDHPFVNYCSYEDLILNGVLINPALFLNLDDEMSSVDTQNVDHMLNSPLNEFCKELVHKDFLKECLQIFMYGSQQLQSSSSFIRQASNILEKCLAIVDHILTIKQSPRINLEVIESIMEVNGYIFFYFICLFNFITN